MELDEQIQKVKALQKALHDVETLLQPKLHVCTQSGHSIVPVDTFFADGTGTEEWVIVASHRGSDRWNILGAYGSKERAMQVYREMLHCSEDEIYEMPLA